MAKQTQIVETLYTLQGGATAQRVLGQDYRRKVVTFFNVTSGGNVFVSTLPTMTINTGGVISTAPGNGVLWEVYFERHGDLVHREFYATSSSPPGGPFLVTIEVLEWDAAAEVGTTEQVFAPDPHIGVPGVDTPDPLERLISQLKQLHHVLRG